MKNSTRVYLVGAGPGDAGLLTVKGRDCLRRANCVLYDNLLNEALLEEVGPDCVLLYTGKAAGRHSMTQAEINTLLLDCAGRYDCVVRLKGGDPYVFGRGGEEALCLRAAGVDFEIVPGVTSAVAGLAYAGIPISHRGLATSFHVITAHTRDEGCGADYVNLAKLDGTLVFLMGLGRVREIAGGLIAAGKSADTPAAAISHATRWDQRTVTAPLAELADQVEATALPSPALIVVGAVVSLRPELDFFERLPLFGKRILVTRTEQQSAGLRQRLARLGAETAAAPMLALRPIAGALDAALERLAQYNYLVFTSRNGLDLFFKALFAAGLDARALHGMTLCAVGAATARALEDYGLRADLQPETARAEALLELLSTVVQPGERVLLPQSAAARPLLREGLARLCRLDAVDLYESVPPETDAGRLREQLAAGTFSAVTFTSSAAVEQFDRAVGLAALGRTACFSIGPVTSRTLRAHGIDCFESEAATIEALADCLVAHREEY